VDTRTFAFHSIFAVVPEDVVPDELIVIYEEVHLARGSDEFDAQSNLYQFFDEYGMREPEKVHVDSKPALWTFAGIRQVLACDEELAWENKLGESAVEVSYLEYRIKYSDLEALATGQRVSLTFTPISRRLRRRGD
jgi:hypothetical protein